MDAIAKLVGAGVSLGGQPVLAGIDLHLAPGRSLGISGPNGSGKTTLVRALATLITFDTGSATVLGVDVQHADLTGVRREIGLIGHQPSLLPELTLAENLEHVARLSGIDAGRVSYALDVVGLDDAADRRAAVCSFGMRRRVEIAHFLLVKPRLLLLDEAASGLDDAAQELIGALLGSVRERDGAAVMVSHDRNHLAEHCDKLFTLASGHLVGTP